MKNLVYNDSLPYHPWNQTFWISKYLITWQMNDICLPFCMFCLICCVCYLFKNHASSLVIDFSRQSVYSIGQILIKQWLVIFSHWLHLTRENTLTIVYVRWKSITKRSVFAINVIRKTSCTHLSILSSSFYFKK